MALTEAKELLFSIADTEIIKQACWAIAKKVKGRLVYEDQLPHSLIFEKAYLNDLPAVLRIYVGSALQLYGDIDDFDDIKIHISSAKLTLLGYYETDKPSKPLYTRVKIDLLRHSVKLFKHSYIQ